MASRRTPPGARSPVMTSTPTPIANGATARSALSPRSSMKAAAPRGLNRGPSLNGEQTVESLTDLLRRETDQKEQILVQLQNKEQSFTELTTESDHLHSALNAAESRLAELYADQARAEDEMATRMEVAEKLRSQVREAEREKRELQRRYNEQTSAFDAERQAFYDNEQHLKSRIQTLSQALNHARTQQPPATPPHSQTFSESETEVEEEAQEDTPAITKDTNAQDFSNPEQDSEEVTALKLELSTLSTSYSSMQSSIQLLQSQLVDLKRVNWALQEENESYMILLREKTLSGQYDVGRHVGVGGTNSSASEEEGSLDGESVPSSRHSLHTVDEEEEEEDGGYDLHSKHELDPSLAAELAGELEGSESGSRRQGGRHKRGQSKSQQGESLAGLPITGPGLDLAAELGRAENKDILSGAVEPPAGPFSGQPVQDKRKRGRKNLTSPPSIPNMSSLASELAASTNKSDVEVLRNEVKSLKDANKALSLYASKIIDRIIAQEGFEHVLSVDYEKEPEPETPVVSSGFKPTLPSAVINAEKATAKARPQSTWLATPSAPMASPAPEKLTTFESISKPPTSPLPPDLPPKSSTSAAAATKRDRRSFSLDWSSFSLFGGDKKPPETPTIASLRPLTLKPGSTALASPILGGGPTSPAIPTARKLETVEDEEDRRERERLAATMKLMGIDKPAEPVMPPRLMKSHSNPLDHMPHASLPVPTRPPLQSHNTTGQVPTIAPAPAQQNKRWSFFRARSSTTTGTPDSVSRNNSGTNSPNPGSAEPAHLTQEALEAVEAEQKLAALDTQEKLLAEQLARGGSGGYTEPVRRSGRRGRMSANGSGSTVWSAGMSKGESDE